ncbi:hypothetical protein MUK42_28576 [Musa troglodytarum]|uniref:Uncharacterized protein n=1 Tax=Musa troglodytarum TaxID=320322 RepID=A0A9E7FVL7_9LILI|nr:hypothetical protein MUK42_28576 [Musa troglodytarum]
MGSSYYYSRGSLMRGECVVSSAPILIHFCILFYAFHLLPAVGTRSYQFKISFEREVQTTSDPTALKETLDANIHQEDEDEQQMIHRRRKVRASCGHNSTEYDRARN